MDDGGMWMLRVVFMDQDMLTILGVYRQLKEVIDEWIAWKAMPDNRAFTVTGICDSFDRAPAILVFDPERVKAINLWRQST